MSFGLVDIDHLMIRVSTLEDTVKQFERMGFTVAPPRLELGSKTPRWRPYDNRLILFEPYPGRHDIANFLGLACLQDQFGAPWPLRKSMSFLWDTEGPKSVVCLARDIEVTAQAMREAGLEVELGGPQSPELGWIDEETGSWLPHRNRPCNPTFRQLPFMTNAYGTDSIETFHHPAFIRHANGARYMSTITGITDDIQRDVVWMSRDVFGVTPVWESADVALIRPRDIVLRIVTPAGFASLYPGIDYSTERILPALAGATIVVSSISRVTETLQEAGVAHVRIDANRVVVPRSAASNTVLEFTTHEYEWEHGSTADAATPRLAGEASTSDTGETQ
jgi:hypothetical protein